MYWSFTSEWSVPFRLTTSFIPFSQSSPPTLSPSLQTLSVGFQKVTDTNLREKVQLVSHICTWLIPSTVNWIKLKVHSLTYVVCVCVNVCVCRCSFVWTQYCSLCSLLVSFPSPFFPPPLSHPNSTSHTSKSNIVMTVHVHSAHPWFSYCPQTMSTWYRYSRWHSKQHSSCWPSLSHMSHTVSSRWHSNIGRSTRSKRSW